MFYPENAPAVADVVRDVLRGVEQPGDTLS